MRFYPGVDPMAWLARTPGVIVDACLRMLPRLEAEEAIARVNATAIGSGIAGAEETRRLSQAWAAAARGAGEALANAEGTPRRRPDPEAALQQHGIPVRRVPKRKVV